MRRRYPLLRRPITRADVVAALAAGGDIDTTCAIIGGILGARATSDRIPPDWLACCEPCVIR
ncbi:ADP-ribosylglycohydrolase family protein [Nocardia sp. NPDC056564]|uniref:ADP-ribosylglycohydrolase family protein n=1 Tax=Nocardia sp. NPDC056564 TaxID=3345865 RepID=UPI00367125E3